MSYLKKISATWGGTFQSCISEGEVIETIFHSGFQIFRAYWKSSLTSLLLKRSRYFHFITAFYAKFGNCPNCLHVNPHTSSNIHVGGFHFGNNCNNPKSNTLYWITFLYAFIALLSSFRIILQVRN